MGLRRYVLAEAGIALGVLAGGSVLSRQALSGVRAVVAARQAQLAEAHMVAMRESLPPHGEISNLDDPTISGEPSGVFMGMSDDLLLERVGTAPVTGVKVNKGGTTLSFRVDFADGTRAAFKPAQTNLQTIPRKEVAAYRLNRLLGLNAVPPAVPLRLSREDLFAHLHPESAGALPRLRAETIFDPSGKTAGVAMYWVPQIVDSGLDSRHGQRESEKWLSQGEPIPAEKRALAAQVSDLIAFDFLTANPDRYSGGNMKMSPDGARLYFMDNTMSFFLDGEGHGRTRAGLTRTQRFSRHFYQALDRVNEPGLQEVLAQDERTSTEILTASEIRAVVARRDALRRHIGTLAMAYGEKNVLVFP